MKNVNKLKKHKLNTYINMNTYNQLNDFIKNNKIITSKLNKRTVITLSLNLLYKTIEHTDISQLMMEYLQDHNTPADDVTVVTKMELVNSISLTDINNESVKWELSGLYDNSVWLKFYITHVNLTELDSKRNPLITKIARKKRVNVTISGYIGQNFMVNKTNIKNSAVNSLDMTYGDIKNKNINITFYDVRIVKENQFNDTLHQLANVPRLIIDNTQELYGFLKPIYVSNGEMANTSYQNIYITFNELETILRNKTVRMGVSDESTDRIRTYHWITEYKKGDNDEE